MLGDQTHHAFKVVEGVFLVEFRVAEDQLTPESDSVLLLESLFVFEAVVLFVF